MADWSLKDFRRERGSFDPMVGRRRKSIDIGIWQSVLIRDHFTFPHILYHPLSFCIPFLLFVLSTNRPHACTQMREVVLVNY
jgi:hypothetical protein